MKSVFFNFLLLAICFNCAAQADTGKRVPEKPAPKRPAALRQNIPAKPRNVATGYKDTVDTKAASGKPVTVNLPERTEAAPYVRVLQQHPYFNFFGTPRQETMVRNTHETKDWMFYLFVGLLLYFACIRMIFGKYLGNLFTVFFRVSLKQKQIREQLMQSPLPSLMLNVFFIIAGGIFISLLLQHYRYLSEMSIWYLMLYSTIALAVVYGCKFLILKLMGWIFYISEATNTYIFAIFLVNKLLGICLIPIIILMAFSGPSMVTALITLSFAMITIFFAYRYFISYAPVQKEIKVSQFHFILYLCAFEIMPLLLIYKVLITFLEKST